MSACFAKDYDASPVGTVTLRLSAEPDQITPASGKTPWELHVVINTAFGAQLLEAFSYRTSGLDLSLRLVERQSSQQVYFVYTIDGLWAEMMENGFLPSMARAHHIAHRAVEWLRQQQT